MSRDSVRWFALRRQVFAISVDSLTNRETRRRFLDPGTLIEDPSGVLAEAKACRLELVTVRAQDRAGRVSLERVSTESLRRALPKPR